MRAVVCKALTGLDGLAVEDIPAPSRALARSGSGCARPG